MIAVQLLAAAIATATPAAAPPTAHQLIVGAEHAVQMNRLDQATVMASRALAAGGSGREMDRLLADLAFAKGKYPEALGRYEVLLKSDPLNPAFLEHAGIAALKIGNVDRSYGFLAAATSTSTATWRSWNALGVAADMKAEWSKADESYAKAAQLAPDEFEPLNNHGWSLVLRGKWSAALPFFEKAVALEPKSERARDNLDLARAALAPQLPERRPGESDESWAARLNDAGLAASKVGDRARATAAFTQALEVSGTWYARAANNLKALANR
jgi:Flp pilus assembly protein TadD